MEVQAKQHTIAELKAQVSREEVQQADDSRFGMLLFLMCIGAVSPPPPVSRLRDSRPWSCQTGQVIQGLR